MEVQNRCKIHGNTELDTCPKHLCWSRARVFENVFYTLANAVSSTRRGAPVLYTSFVKNVHGSDGPTDRGRKAPEMSLLRAGHPLNNLRHYTTNPSVFKRFTPLHRKPISSSRRQGALLNSSSPSRRHQCMLPCQELNCPT